MLHRQPGVQARTGFCLPRTACPVCWPDGFPSSYNWDLFQGKDPQTPDYTYEGPEVGNRDWLRSTIDAAFPIDGIQAQGNAKPSFVEKPDSFIAKMLKKLRNDP